MSKSLSKLINGRVMPFFMRYLEEICEKQDELTIDGVKVLNDAFIPGSIVLTYVEILRNADLNSAEHEFVAEKLRTLINFAAQKDLKTWGIFFFLSGLNLLKNNNYLLKVVDEQTLEILKSKLDWRSFVNPEDLSMKDLPTNYYGVALRIATLRALLGWESENYSTRLYDKLMHHIDTYSGEYGYMDETAGEGRFDNYTMALPEELRSTFVMSGKDIPKSLKKMVANAHEVLLNMANDKGYGFCYGRSIGAHGDLAVVCALTEMAMENCIPSEHTDEYYAYVVDSIDKYLNFWISDRTNLINCWDEGRRTDWYRHKGRILEVNIGLMKKIYQIYLNWNKLGYASKEPMPGDKRKLFDSLKPFTFFRFAKSKYDRGLAIIRDGGYVFSLPIINGGSANFDDTPYLPVPNLPLMLETAPDSKHPHLVPRILLSDGKSIMPISYIKNITTSENGSVFSITYEQDELCVIGERVVKKFEGLKSKTTYIFSPGIIEKMDEFYPVKTIDIKEIILEFGTFSEEPQWKGDRVLFRRGSIYEYEVIGLNICNMDAVENIEDFKTTHGSLKNNIVFKSENIKTDKPFCIKWILKYR